MRALADLLYAACNNPAKWLQAGTDAAGARRLAVSLKTRLREARRYRIDPSVTAAASILGIEHPDILLSMLRQATLPFGVCWLEWDNHTQLTDDGHVLAADAPRRVGCLLERLDPATPQYRVTIIAGDYPDQRAPVVTMSLIQISYQLHQPMPMDSLSAGPHSIAALTGLPADYIRKTLIGSAYIARGLPASAVDEIAHRRALCDTLASHATITASAPLLALLAPPAGQPRLPPDDAATALRAELLEQSGSWRFVISLLALLNQREYVDSATPGVEPGRRYLSHGKLLPYLEQRLVTLRLPRQTVLRQMRRIMTEAIPRRRHDVSGHWRESRSKGLPGCEHAYVDETPTRQVCVQEGCGHKRWFVADYERGDATLGSISKDRHVTLD